MKNLSIIILVFVVVACNSGRSRRNVDAAHHFIPDGKISVDFDKPADASLFDYFKSIEIIPLETNSDVVMNPIYKMLEAKNQYFFFSLEDAIIWSFDREGKFLFKLDKKGRGPGEYSSVSNIYLNPYTGNLDVLELFGGIVSYDLQGQLVGEQKFTFDGLRVLSDFVMLNPDTAVFFQRAENEKLIYFNLKTKTLLHRDFEEDRELSSFSGRQQWYEFEDEWYFYRPFHTHVYRVGRDSLEDVYHFDFGKDTRDGLQGDYSATATGGNSPETFRAAVEAKCRETVAKFPYCIYEVGENQRYVIAQIRRWTSASANPRTIFKTDNEMCNIMYDKTSQSVKYITRWAEQVDLRPELVTDSYILSFCQVEDLPRYVNADMLNERDKARLKALSETAEEQNPIVIKYNF